MFFTIININEIISIKYFHNLKRKTYILKILQRNFLVKINILCILNVIIFN
jgi:hypothetical protein